MSIKYGSLPNGLKELEPKMPEVNTAVVGAATKQAPEVVVEEKQSPRKTVTNWKALYDTKLHPSFVKCEGYHPMHPFCTGCHTVMNLKPEQLVSHLDSEHGGGFFLSFRQGYQNDPIGARDIKLAYWDGWLKLQELGIEIRDLRCALCNQEIPVNSRSIVRHLKPHAGNSTRVKPGGDFWITLSHEVPQESVEDEF
jgi:hypothetical protein